MLASVSPRPRRRASIIAALLAAAALALAGCSALKLGYGQADAFVFRWLDGYVDFNDAQSVRVRAALDEFFAWHRRTQLPDYAALLARAESDVLADTTPERMCGWADAFRQRFDAALDHVAPTLAEVALTLSPQQLANIEKRYRQRNEEYRDDYLQRDPGKRKESAAEREIDRAEMLYGRLDDPQRAFVRRSVAASPFDADLAYAERLGRQQDALATMRRLVVARATQEEAMQQLRAFEQRLDHSPRPGYQVYAERMVDYNCTFASALHNLTSDAQRRNAAQKLRGYETTLRELAGSPG